MKQLKPILWTKGTFLTPQHLQVQDRFLEDTLNFRLQALKFCPWGFRELAINSELLADGQFAVTRASGIFPDGLLFEIPEADPPPPSKSACVGSTFPARKKAAPVISRKSRHSGMRTPVSAKSRFRSLARICVFSPIRRTARVRPFCGLRMSRGPQPALSS